MVSFPNGLRNVTEGSFLPANPSFGYRAFGLHFVSDRSIPGLEISANTGLPEVILHWGNSPPYFDSARYTDLYYLSKNSSTPSGRPFLVIRKSRDPVTGYWLEYEDGTNVFITDSESTIWVT